MRSRRSHALMTACVLAGVSAASASAWGGLGGTAAAPAHPVLRASASSALPAHAALADRAPAPRADRGFARPSLPPAAGQSATTTSAGAATSSASSTDPDGAQADQLAGLTFSSALSTTPSNGATALAPSTSPLTLDQQEAKTQLTLAEQAEALRERQAAAKAAAEAAAKAKATAAAEAAQAAALAKAHRWVRPNYAGISSPFGMRWGRMHEGVDLAGQYGTPILAATSGTVIYAGPESGYGRIVKIQDWDGTQTWYGHMEKFLVKAGDKVTPGQEIALVGAAGDATGPHLHFEVHVNGQVIDPVPFMRARGIDL